MAYTNFDWDREVTVTLTVRDLYYLQHCADSVLTMGEVSDFTLGYEKLSPTQYNGIKDALIKAVGVLKESRVNA